MASRWSRAFGCLVAAALIGLLPALAFARNQVTLEVDKERVTMGDVLRCDVTLTIEDEDALSDIRQPSFEGFIVRERNSSQQHYTQIVNFRASSQKILTTTYILEPKTLGTLVVGPASFVEGGRRVESQRVEIQVVELHAQNGSRAFGNDALSAPLSQEESRQPQLFLRLIPEHPTLYIGEQQAVSLYLYTAQVELSRWAPNAPSQFPGFASLRLDLPKNGESKHVVIGRTEYRVDTLDRFLLTAKEVGTHIVTPYRAKVLVGDGFFGGRWVDIVSPPVEITVKAVPEEGKPQGFDLGHVGRFTLKATLDRGQTEVGQPVTYILTLLGAADLDRVTMPTLPEVPGLKIYPPTIRKDSYQKGVRLEGKREAEYLIVPQAPGRYTLPALDFVSFDSESGSYRTQSTPSFEIEAIPSKGGATTLSGASAAAPVYKQNLEAAQNDLRPLRPASRFRAVSTAREIAPWIWAVVALPFVVIGGFALAGGASALSRRLFLSAARQAQKRRKALLTRLEAAQNAPDPAFFADLKSYLYMGIEPLLSEAPAGLTYDRLRTRLVAAGMEEARCAELVELLEACDAAPYAPALIKAPELLVRAKRFCEGGK